MYAYVWIVNLAINHIYLFIIDFIIDFLGKMLSIRSIHFSEITFQQVHRFNDNDNRIIE